MDVRLDESAINNLASPGGVVGQHLAHLGDQTAAEARALAPVKSGALRQSIRTERVGDVVQVVADTEYALAVHEGTAPHVIEPKQAQVLRFPTKAGMVFASRVNHPGTKPNRFLWNALLSVARR